MKLRRLTAEGIEQFRAYLTNLKDEPTLEPPRRLLAETATSEPIAADVDVEGMQFATRFEAATYLDSKLTATSIASPERDTGLWAWLALFYFEQLCPIRKDGMRKAGEEARYIPALGNFKRFYRHLLLGPFMIYRAHSDEPQRVRGVLATAVNSPGDIVEQLASRQELITNRAVMGVVTTLYVDDETGKLKRGSGGKGDGSPRRLADILNQFDLTYDLYAMSSSGLANLLPKEFNRFRA